MPLPGPVSSSRVAGSLPRYRASRTAARDTGAASDNPPTVAIMHSRPAPRWTRGTASPARPGQCRWRQQREGDGNEAWHSLHELHASPAAARRCARRSATRRSRPTRRGSTVFTAMDHWFQMEHFATAHDPMLEGYSVLSFVAAKTERLRLGLLVTGVTYRHPGPARQDRHHARRAVRRPGDARHRRGLVRARAPRARRAVPAGGRAVRAARGGHPDLRADVERQRRPVRGQALPARRDDLRAAPDPVAAPADPDRRRRREEDAAARREVRRRLQPVRHVGGRRRAQARGAARALRRARAATTTPSARRSSAG